MLGNKNFILGFIIIAGILIFSTSGVIVEVFAGHISEDPVEEEIEEVEEETGNAIYDGEFVPLIEDAQKKGELIETQQAALAEGDAETLQGGCLIATATYGSEFAPQVQMLREIRDNVVLETTSGTAFMTAFNQFYYSFSPTIADWERENTVFREAVKLTITPLLTSLSILNYVDINSEGEMLGYGIGVILLNIGMYFVAPVVVITKLRK